MAIDTDSRAILRTIAALKEQKAYIFHQGGTSSGKTFGILYALLFFCLKYGKRGTIVSIVAENLPTHKRGAITDFKTILIETGIEHSVKLNKSDYTFHLPNGVKFEFFATDNEGKAKSGKRDILFLNEANNIKWSIANQLMMRTRMTIIADWNPSGKFWLHRMLLPALLSKDYLFTRTTYRDNKNVDKKIAENIERLKYVDPNLYDVYALGLESKGSEMVFPNWELVDEFPANVKTCFGLDFGYTADPSAAVLCGYQDGGLYYDEIFYERGLNNPAIAKLLKPYGKLLGTGVADSAEPKSIAELQGLGLNIIPATKGPDSVSFGLQRMNQYKLFVTKRSKNWIDEADSYKFIVKDGVPTQTPKPGNDHLMDASRYAPEAIFGVAPKIGKPQVRTAVSVGLNDLSF